MTKIILLAIVGMAALAALLLARRTIEHKRRTERAARRQRHREMDREWRAFVERGGQPGSDRG